MRDLQIQKNDKSMLRKLLPWIVLGCIIGGLILWGWYTPWYAVVKFEANYGVVDVVKMGPLTQMFHSLIDEKVCPATTSGELTPDEYGNIIINRCKLGIFKILPKHIKKVKECHGEEQCAFYYADEIDERVCVIYAEEEETVCSQDNPVLGIFGASPSTCHKEMKQVCEQWATRRVPNPNKIRY